MNHTDILKQKLKHLNVQPELILLKKITTSTNDDVLQLHQQMPNLQSILVCSEQQTSGRGQHQRTWCSPQGQIYLSCLAGTKKNLNGILALEIALNILNMPTFKEHSLSIKWVNDLYSKQGKWGGILIEPINQYMVIVGIGINVYPLSLQDKNQIQQATTSLQELNISFERLQLIAELYAAVQQAIQWFNHGSQNLVQRFQHHAYLLEEYIHFHTEQQHYYGKYLGINTDGALLLETNQQILSFYHGRIHLI